MNDLNGTVELRAHGVTACGIVADVGQEGEVERFVAEAATALGRVDLLVAMQARMLENVASLPQHRRSGGRLSNSTSAMALG
ncbi:MAG TPA: hypothetical protein VFQ77_06135 [Pseudonocardiaceae bacterium]|jgi:NAD(P)-dependent dehydrogenase (short-subunit alcohol dehydrogenase family)|nr:hypothetical protein [Pseudonocardiaceae bacterium]